MEVLRYSRDVWSQKTLEGVAFELFWVFLGLGLALIVGHWAYCRFFKRGEP